MSPAASAVMCSIIYLDPWTLLRFLIMLSVLIVRPIVFIVLIFYIVDLIYYSPFLVEGSPFDSSLLLYCNVLCVCVFPVTCNVLRLLGQITLEKETSVSMGFYLVK